jgi:hypothetical protein
MIFLSFTGVLKNIFSKKKDFSVFDQPPISDAGQGIYRSPIGGFQGRRKGFPLCCSNKYPINTLSGPSPGSFPGFPEISRKMRFIFYHSDETPKSREFESPYLQQELSVGWILDNPHVL